MINLNYTPPGPVAREFMRSDEFVRGIRGPVGSGKSVTCAIEIIRRAMQQRPSPDGVRRTRWLVIRNTFPELKTTTIKTWLEWFPESSWGRFTWATPPTHNIRFGDVHAEIIFLALDVEDDVSKMRSLEATGVWLNEARYIPKVIVDVATERVGRYPPKWQGGPTWYGVIMDTNAMDPDHWWPIIAGDMPPPEDMSDEDRAMLQVDGEWAFFNQPGGLIEVRDEQGRFKGYEINLAAENLPNLPDRYYQRQISGKAKEWVDRYLCNKIVVHIDGKAVYQCFNQDVHVAREPLPILPDGDVILGMDFGLTPAVVFGQSVGGRWLIQREMVFRDMGVARAVPLLHQALAEWYPGNKVVLYGDPAGDERAQTDEVTPYMILNSKGFSARSAGTNDFSLRVGSVDSVMTRLHDGKPAIVIDPSCTHLIKACAGGYHYPKIKASGGVRYDVRPLKNESSHVAEALQYFLVGVGEARALTSSRSRSKPRVAKERKSIWSRRRH